MEGKYQHSFTVLESQEDASVPQLQYLPGVDAPELQFNWLLFLQQFIDHHLGILQHLLAGTEQCPDSLLLLLE